MSVGKAGVGEGYGQEMTMTVTTASRLLSSDLLCVPRPILTLNKLPTFVHAVVAEHIGKTRDILQITRDVARGCDFTAPQMAATIPLPSRR